MRWLLALLLCLILVPISAASAHQQIGDEPATVHYPATDHLVSLIAKHSVEARAYATPEGEDGDAVFALWGAWGYVEITQADHATVRRFVLEEAEAIAEHRPSPSGDEWAQALSVLVLVHEAWHLRDIKNNDNEAVTECRAIKTFPKAVVWLGGPPQLANSLLAEALWIHRYGMDSRYRLKSCKLPKPELPG